MSILFPTSFVLILWSNYVLTAYYNNFKTINLKKITTNNSNFFLNQYFVSLFFLYLIFIILKNWFLKNYLHDFLHRFYKLYLYYIIIFIINKYIHMYIVYYPQFWYFDSLNIIICTEKCIVMILWWAYYDVTNSFTNG